MSFLTKQEFEQAITQLATKQDIQGLDDRLNRTYLLLMSLSNELDEANRSLFEIEDTLDSHAVESAELAESA